MIPVSEGSGSDRGLLTELEHDFPDVAAIRK